MADTERPTAAPTPAPTATTNATEGPRDVEMTAQTLNVLTASPGHAIGQTCPDCCHWALAANVQPRRVREYDKNGRRVFYVGMLFEEWLAYHHHIVTHQQLDRRLQVLSA